MQKAESMGREEKRSPVKGLLQHSTGEMPVGGTRVVAVGCREEGLEMF